VRKPTGDVEVPRPKEEEGEVEPLGDAEAGEVVEKLQEEKDSVMSEDVKIEEDA